MSIELHLGDCLDVMAGMEAESVDTVITDPPYGLTEPRSGRNGHGQMWQPRDAEARAARRGGFMGKKWDAGVPGPEYWAECLRVAKPGAMLCAFGGTRTHHRLMCAIEDAGWEIRDVLMWVYGSGFPKSHDVSKAIDKAAGAEREVTGKHGGNGYKSGGGSRAMGIASGYQEPAWTGEKRDIPATDDAALWDGWGTALKPAWEIVIAAQKPLTTEREQDIIVANLLQVEAQLWSLLPASIAEKSFGLSEAEHAEVCGFARWTADERHSIQADLCDQMDTLRFVSVVSTCLNTVTLWNSILIGHLRQANTSTTETATGQTIDWKILRSCVSALTPRSIIQAEIEAPGSRLSALPAARYLNAAAESINATRTLSVLGDAIEKGHTSHPDDLGLVPEYEPIILAMKPLPGTFAQNALEYGVAGIWVDGVRVPSNGGKAKFPAGVTSDSESVYGGGNGLYENRPRPTDSNPSGRWPANLLLSHAPGCECVGVRKVKPGNGSGRASGKSWQNTSVFKSGGVDFEGATYASPDGTETIDDWRCVEGGTFRIPRYHLQSTAVDGLSNRETLVDFLCALTETVGDYSTSGSSLARRVSEYDRNGGNGSGASGGLVSAIASAANLTKAPGFRFDCLSCLHSGDALIRDVLACVQGDAPSLAGALSVVLRWAKGHGYSQSCQCRDRLTSSDDSRRVSPDAGIQESNTPAHNLGPNVDGTTPHTPGTLCLDSASTPSSTTENKTGEACTCGTSDHTAHKLALLRLLCWVCADLASYVLPGSVLYVDHYTIEEAPCPVRLLDEQSGERVGFAGGGTKGAGFRDDYVGGDRHTRVLPAQTFSDTGGASRFFTRFHYSAKASRSERESGLLGHIPCLKCGELDSVTHVNPKTGKEEKCRRNGHPTVKPLDVCRWLCRLTKTPTGGAVLDPFMGSGRIPMAAILEGRETIGIELERPSFDIAEAGVRWAQEQIPEMVQGEFQCVI